MHEIHSSPSLRRRAIAFVACTLAATGLALAASAEPYALVDLGVDVSPEDVNDLRVVVGSRQLAPGETRAFLYTPGDGSLRDLEGTVARAVNGSGVVVGDSATGAFLFDGSSTVELPDAGARGINEGGIVAGYVAMENPYRPSPLPLAPALYDGADWRILDVAKVYPRGTREGVYADLYVLADVNEAGTAVGTKSRSGLYGSSAILTPPAFDRVVYLPIPGGGRAAAINDSDLVVGTTGEDPSAQMFAHAFLYDGTSVRDLGTLHGGLRSSASDINASGQVVGSAWLSTVLTSLYQPELYHAFLWEEGSGMRDLNEIVAEPGWILTSATAINDAGDIVGTAIVAGQLHGYLLVAGGQPPPPPPVGAPPVAVAGSDVTKGKAPLTVRFTSTGSYDPDGSGLAYEWSFGDGAASDQPDPTHTYTETGDFVATLTVWDDEGLSDVAELAISVRGPKRRSP